MYIKLYKEINILRKTIFILNAIIFLLNIFLFFYILYKIKFCIRIIFRKSDYFIINYAKKSFKAISNYLANKYKINSREIVKSSFPNKKMIRIKSTGLFSKERHIKWLINKLGDNFIIKFDDPKPDYIIYNVFTNEDTKSKYHKAIRIAVYTENIFPDINNADYIIGHYHINYLDRYFKYSVFLWEDFTNIEKKRKEVLKKPVRQKFCAAVISNCRPFLRLSFIEKLNKYKKIDMGGKCRNNINTNITNKKEFLSEYKFSIAMENSPGDGYSSEKIVDSFSAGTIPIYFGDYLIDEFINPKTYILIKGKKDMDEKIEYIKKIDQDDKLYKSIMKEKPILDKNFINKIDNIEIKEFLKNIFSQDKKEAYRRDNNYYNFNCG